jgi:hypothetical protein
MQWLVFDFLSPLRVVDKQQEGFRNGFEDVWRVFVIDILLPKSKVKFSGNPKTETEKNRLEHDPVVNYWLRIRVGFSSCVMAPE